MIMWRIQLGEGNVDKLELLYEHYKDTNSLKNEAQARRNKSFIMLCILEATSFLLLIRPEKVIEIM